MNCLKTESSVCVMFWVCYCVQGPALEALWQQCSGDNDLVRSVCCEALVLLVDQGHAGLQYVLNGVLNLLPSARYRHTFSLGTQSSKFNPFLAQAQGF